MRIKVIGSTLPGICLPIKEAKIFSGQSAGICYMKSSFKKILGEPKEDMLKRFNNTARLGHHSVAEHVSYNLLLSGIPKIIAMILNNEKDYSTSEKSARFTRMKTSGKEKMLYEKWIKKFKQLISDEYPQLKKKIVQRLAQENARYFISVFTPATTMEYTVNFRQGNYLIGFLESPNLANQMPEEFYQKLKPWLDGVAKALRRILNCDEIRDNKKRELSLFATRNRDQSFGEVYSVNYLGSFAHCAQAQRHRTLDYEIMVPSISEKVEFFVPELIRENDAVREEYLSDMLLVAENYPQGMMVAINERGTPENFILKCNERLCGAAQWEICMQTKAILEEYHAKTKGPVSDMLSKYLGKTKCQFGNYTCKRPCPLGSAQAFTRKV